MKITLIKPNIGRRAHSLYVDEGRMEPLQLGVLAALTPPDVEVVLHDDRIEPIPYDDPTDLVAITVETFTARRAYEISAEFRQRGVPVILGGMHPTLLPAEAAQHADAIYLGDAEFLWAQVIADAQAGRLQPRYVAASGSPQPQSLTRRELFTGKGYLPITLLQFSRGCRFACQFCATSVFFQQTHHCRSIMAVVQIETQERKLLFFVDDNMLANVAAAKALFRALMPLNVTWVSQASLDLTEDRELLELMVKSGCLGHVIGLESLNFQNLQAIGKTPNLVRQFERYQPQLLILREYGLHIWAAFTFGYDHDTVESLVQTVDFAIAQQFAFAAFNILMPYPRTPLYQQLQQAGRLLYDGCWWLHPEYRFNHAAFRPQHMSPEELTIAGFQARDRFNRPLPMLQRAWQVATNSHALLRVIPYLTYAVLFRKEVYKKQGMHLGLR